MCGDKTYLMLSKVFVGDEEDTVDAIVNTIVQRVNQDGSTPSPVTAYIDSTRSDTTAFPSVNLRRHIRQTTFAKILLLMLLFTPIIFLKAVSEFEVLPTHPKQGDEVTFLLKGQPGEEVEISIFFTKNITVSLL